MSWKPDDGEDDNWALPTQRHSYGHSNGDGFDIDPENISKHHGGGADGECYGCGQTGHIRAECPNAPQNSGECYNCGQQGHNKADCPDPRVEREFTGVCRLCGHDGHRADACPDVVCGNCKETGHNANTCTNARNIYDDDTPIMQTDEAWTRLIDADKEKDIEGFKSALKAYTRGQPDMTFVDVESALRESNCNTFIIAKEQEVSATFTIVNLQGKKDCKYVVSFQFENKPRRPKFAQGWPSSPEENLARLADAGYVLDRMVIKCYNCGEIGHSSKQCTEEPAEREKVEVACSNCKETGHWPRDCPNPRPDRDACRNCKQPGHKASDCTEPRSAEGVECKHCLEVGHFAKDCPTRPPEICRNCLEEGHRAAECSSDKVWQCTNCEEKGHTWKECTQKKDWSKVKCRNCDEYGHTRVRCQKPPKEEEGGMGNGGDADAAGGDDGWGEDAAPAAGSTGGGDDWSGAAAPAVTAGW